MSQMYERLKAYLESEEGKRSMKEYAEKIHKKQMYIESVSDRFHNWDIEKRIHFIEAVVKKYSSKEYTDREYFTFGREPVTELYWYYYEYAIVYGVNVLSKYASENPDRFYFTTELYKTPEGFYVERMDGQGSVVHVFNETEFQEIINKK